jgi:hypothetical protein
MGIGILMELLMGNFTHGRVVTPKMALHEQETEREIESFLP